jgi:hypothetical protein
MNPHTADHTAPLHQAAQMPLETPEDFEAAQHSPRYCPSGLLADFALLMAGHGRCVNTAVMLGDREYAMWQLACARTLGNDELAALAVRLFAYFDEAPHPSPLPRGDWE